MPSKQVEDVYNARKAERAASPRKQEMSAKLAGYGEGILHGYAIAQQQIESITGGAITLNPPREVMEWEARLKRARRD